MAKLVSLKIDVTKIDKARLYKGQKGTYLDATVYLLDEPDEYGNSGMITQSVSKEERESGVKGAILGNVKILKDFGTAEAKPEPKPAPKPVLSTPPPTSQYDDDLPF
jgi:hypothetical protein